MAGVKNLAVFCLFLLLPTFATSCGVHNLTAPGTCHMTEHFYHVTGQDQSLVTSDLNDCSRPDVHPECHFCHTTEHVTQTDKNVREVGKDFTNETEGATNNVSQGESQDLAEKPNPLGPGAHSTSDDTNHVAVDDTNSITVDDANHVTMVDTNHVTIDDTNHVTNWKSCEPAEPPRSVNIPLLQYSPAPLGVEVRGVDLKNPNLPHSVVEQIKRDLHVHRLLIFKDQGVVSAERHVEITRWFGELESRFRTHPKAERPEVLRVSNDPSEGKIGVGRSGWHNDGGFYEKPYAITIYHMVSVPTEGDTQFVPTKELVASVPLEVRERWDRLWVVDNRWNGRNPLLYAHPVTGEPAMCIHLGGVIGFVWDYQTEKERYTDRAETEALIAEISKEIVKDNERLVYSHKWEVGDFIFADNLALLHQAAPQSQWPRDKVGLRLLHRTAVIGTHVPSKRKQTKHAP